jgi:heme exporter protein C
MQRGFTPLVVVAMGLFAGAPFYIAAAPDELTMGLVQKIFYFHVPSAFVLFTSAIVCGISSVRFLAGRKPASDRVALAAAELTVVFGLIVLVTGPLWARKAWGVWWQWDARLTSSLLLWMIFVAYMLLRRYAGPGTETLCAVLAVFGMANIPFVYISVNVWRTLHPGTSVVPALAPGMRGPFWYCVLAFLLLYVVLMAARVRLEAQRAELERLYLEADDRGWSAEA